MNKLNEGTKCIFIYISNIQGAAERGYEAGVNSADTDEVDPTAATSDTPEMAGEYITGVGGNVIHLTNMERQDPAVIQKYK